MPKATYHWHGIPLVEYHLKILTPAPQNVELEPDEREVMLKLLDPRFDENELPEEQRESIKAKLGALSLYEARFIFARTDPEALNQLKKHLNWGVPAGFAPTAIHRLDRLTSQELHIMELITQGLTAKSVANHLSYGYGTLRAKLVLIYAKLGVKNRSEAVQEYLCLYKYPPNT